MDSSEGIKLHTKEETGGRGRAGDMEDLELTNGDTDSKDNWQVVERKPVILPHSRPMSPG